MTLETAQTYMNTVSFVHPCIHEIFDTGLVFGSGETNLQVSGVRSHT